MSNQQQAGRQSGLTPHCWAFDNLPEPACASEDFQARTTTRKGTVLGQQWVWLSALSVPYPIIHSGSGWLAGAGMSFFCLCLCLCPCPNQTLFSTSTVVRSTTTMVFFHMASTRAPSAVIAVNTSSSPLSKNHTNLKASH